MAKHKKNQDSTKAHPAYLGIDLGGSNIFAVAYDKKWNPLAELKQDTRSKEGYKAVLNRIVNMAIELGVQMSAKNFQIDALGLCIPGVIETKKGRVSIAPNLGWKNVFPGRDLRKLPFIKKLSQFTILNDVNAGLIGELSVIKKPPSIALAYFCGTGIGGAVFINGKLVTGLNGGAGEVGHVVVRAGGKKQNGIQGSLESYIGKWALNAKIQRAFDKNIETELRKIITYDLQKTPIKSSSLSKAFDAGDAFTVKLLREYYCRYLGIAISQSANLLEPELVILGGGIMEAMGSKLIEDIKTNLKKHTIVSLPQLRLASLGDYAGVRGAVLAARNI